VSWQNVFTVFAMGFSRSLHLQLGVLLHKIGYICSSSSSTTSVVSTCEAQVKNLWISPQTVGVSGDNKW
jgi:hypothetical protein